MKNTLHYGDNLDVLRRHIADESVDLVYLVLPFNSDQNYNVMFAERDGTQSAAQIRVFDDTWNWGTAAAAAYEDVVEGGVQVSLAMQEAFCTVLGDTPPILLEPCFGRPLGRVVQGGAKIAAWMATESWFRPPPQSCPTRAAERHFELAIVARMLRPGHDSRPKAWTTRPTQVRTG